MSNNGHYKDIVNATKQNRIVCLVKKSHDSHNSISVEKFIAIIAHTRNVNVEENRLIAIYVTNYQATAVSQEAEVNAYCAEIVPNPKEIHQ